MSELLNSLYDYGLKQVSSDQYLCRCPNHDDRSPSLSIKLMPDDLTLIHCFAGCQAEDILSSLGLTYSALFPDDPNFDKEVYQKKKRNRFTETQCKRCYVILKVAEDNLKRGMSLTSDDKVLVKKAQKYLKDFPGLNEAYFKRFFMADYVDQVMQNEYVKFQNMPFNEKYGLSHD